MKFLPVLSGVGALCMSFAAAAQPVIQEKLIVTGTYSPTVVEQLASSATVMDRGRIQQLDKLHLADVLQSIPGVLIERQGGPGGLAVASIRGGESNYTVVMVDGVAMNDPGNSRGGAFDLGNINVDSIERIEVVRGPQSAIYGADALAGVINIITLRASQGHQQYLNLEAGRKQGRQFGGSALGASDTVNYAVQWRSRDTGETVKGSEAKDTELNLRFGWTPDESHQLTANYRRFDGERTSYPENSGGPLLAISPLLDASDYLDQSLALTWNYQILDGWRSHLQAVNYQRDEEASSPGIAPYDAVPANSATTRFEREQITWINTLGRPGDTWSNIGVERRKESGNSHGFLDMGFKLPTHFAMARTTNSVFVDLNAYVFAPLLIQAGVRYDDTDGIGSETTAKLGLRYQASDTLVLFANAGEGYKLPSFFALGHPLVGNDALLPEKVNSIDAGVEWDFSATASTTLGVFHNCFTDPIDFDPETFTNVNRERINTRGVEWQANWQDARERISLHGHATYTDFNVKNDVSVLTGRPKWRAGMASSWQIDERWRAGLDYQWVDTQYASSQHAGYATLHRLDDWHRLDATLSWKLLANLTARASIENLFGNDYETAKGFPAAERLWRIGFQWQFSQ